MFQTQKIRQFSIYEEKNLEFRDWVDESELPLALGNRMLYL